MNWKNLHFLTRAGIAMAPGLLMFYLAIAVPSWINPKWNMLVNMNKPQYLEAMISLVVFVVAGSVIGPILLISGLFADRRPRTLLQRLWPFGVHVLSFGLVEIFVTVQFYRLTRRLTFRPLTELAVLVTVYFVVLLVHGLFFRPRSDSVALDVPLT